MDKGGGKKIESGGPTDPNPLFFYNRECNIDLAKERGGWSKLPPPAHSPPLLSYCIDSNLQLTLLIASLRGTQSYTLSKSVRQGSCLQAAK